MSDLAVKIKTDRIFKDINRWSSGLEFINLINNDDTNISDIVNILTEKRTANESCTMQVNRGISYRTMLNTVEKESLNWSSD